MSLKKAIEIMLKISYLREKRIFAIIISSFIALSLSLVSTSWVSSKFGFGEETDQLFFFIVCSVMMPSVIGSTLTTVIGKNIRSLYIELRKKSYYKLKVATLFSINGMLTLLLYLGLTFFFEKTLQIFLLEMLAYSTFQLAALILQAMNFSMFRYGGAILTNCLPALMGVIGVEIFQTIYSVILGYIVGLILQVLYLWLSCVNKFRLNYYEVKTEHEETTLKLSLPITLNIVQNLLMTGFSFFGRSALSWSQRDALSVYTIAEKIPLNLHNLTSNSVGLEILYAAKETQNREIRVLKSRFELVIFTTTLLFILIFLFGFQFFKILFEHGKITNEDIGMVFEVVLLLMLLNIITGFSIVLSNYLYASNRSIIVSSIGILQFSLMLAAVSIYPMFRTPVGLVYLQIASSWAGALVKVFWSSRFLQNAISGIVRTYFTKSIFISLISTNMIIKVDSHSDFQQSLFAIAMILGILFKSEIYKNLVSRIDLFKGSKSK